MEKWVHTRSVKGFPSREHTANIAHTSLQEVHQVTDSTENVSVVRLKQFSFNTLLVWLRS